MKIEKVAKHEHKWTVVSGYWQCKVCKRIYGLKKKPF